MKKSPFIVLLLILALFPGAATTARAEQATLELNQNHTDMHLSSFFWFMEDAEGSFTADDLMKPDFQNRFAPLDRKTPNFGLSRSAWWARANLRNTSDRPLILYLTQQYAQVDFIDFWQLTPSGEQVAHIHRGDRAPKDPQAVVNRLPTFRMELPPGETSVIIRMKTDGSGLFQIKAQTEQAFFDSRTVEYAFICSMLGMLVCMAVYNFFIWMQLRKAVYLVYVVFIISMVLQQWGFSGLPGSVIEGTWFMNEGALLFTAVSILTGTMFTMMFLSLPRRHPWLNRLCWCIIALIPLCALALLHSYNSALKAILLASFGGTILVIVAGFVSCWKRFRPAYFFTIAWLTVMVASLIRSSMLSGAFPVNFISEWGMLIGTVLEVMLLSLAIADKIRITEKYAFNRIEALNTELKKEHDIVVSLNTNLERLVEEQTREIKSILRHIQIGILVIRKDNLEITDTHSVSMKNLLHTNQIAGRNAIDLLFGNAVISREIISQAQSVLENCLGEDAVNFEANCHLLPVEAKFRFGQDERIMQFDWNPVVDKEGVVEKFLVSIKDVTTQKQLEADAAEKSKELGFIGEILDISARQFGIFINSSQRFMADNARLLKANLKPEREVLKILFINMHTIKGAARALGLKLLTPVIHEAEQNLSAVLKKTKEWDRDDLLADCERIRHLLDQYQHLNQTKLGRNSTDVVSFTVDFIERVRQLLLTAESEGTTSLRMKAKPLRESIEELSFTRAETVLREVLSNAEMLARDLQKECPQIAIHDNGVQLTTEGQELIRNAFIHIIRNSMDHGIETADERVAKGKAAEGLIDVQMDVAGGQLQIRYRDDGRGLNLRAIRRLATERGLISEKQRLGMQDIAYLIFEPGFSTCEATSEISGRGVGMSAVKEYIEAEGGSAVIHLFDDDKVVNPDFVHFEFIFTIGSRFFIQKAA